MPVPATDLFEVIVRKRIPYLTKFSGAISLLLFIFLLLAFIIALPSHANFYHMLDDVSHHEKLWNVFLLAIPAFIISYFFYSRIRLKRNAVLTFDTDKIQLRGRGWSKSFAVNKIRYFDCYDYIDGHSAEMLFALEIRNWSGKSTMMNLKDYSQATRLMDILTVYEEVKLQVVADKPTNLSREKSEL